MEKLHVRYLGKKGSTDILSFYEPVAGDPQSGMGSLVLCPDTISTKWKTEISEMGTVAVYQRLVIHGFVHLMGFDHETEVQARKMNQVEQHLMVKCDSSYGKKRE